MKKVYVNPSRRDLIRQLLAMGVVVSSSLLNVPASFARQGESTASMTGQATWRTDSNYEKLRNSLTWKPNIPARYPDVIVHASSEEEIILALAFAEKNDLQIVSRNSGHNIDSLRNGGMMLDISRMTDFSIDEENMQASVQPALTSYFFYEHLAKRGLIFPVPECLSVSMGGYLLGGGYASMGFSWGDGPACYSVIAADVILADGRKVTASKDENTDLFWAIRGIGPGFFGVVTSFQLQLYKQPGVFMQSSYSYPAATLGNVLSQLEQLKDRKHRNTQIAVVLQKNAGPSNLPMVTLDVRALGRHENETRGLLSTYGDIETDKVTSSNEYEQVNYSSFMYNPSRNERNFSDNIWTDDRNAITAVIELCKTLPAGSSFITTLYNDRQLFSPREDSCFSSSGRHFMSNHLLWAEAKSDGLNWQWYEKLCSILWPYASSYYVNQMEGTEQANRVAQCFSKENWQRLSELRQQYDPGKRFFAHVT